MTCQLPSFCGMLGILRRERSAPGCCELGLSADKCSVGTPEDQEGEVMWSWLFGCSFLSRIVAFLFHVFLYVPLILLDSDFGIEA